MYPIDSTYITYCLRYLRHRPKPRNLYALIGYIKTASESRKVRLRLHLSVEMSLHCLFHHVGEFILCSQNPPEASLTSKTEAPKKTQNFADSVNLTST